MLFHAICFLLLLGTAPTPVLGVDPAEFVQDHMKAMKKHFREVCKFNNYPGTCTITSIGDIDRLDIGDDHPALLPGHVDIRFDFKASGSAWEDTFDESYRDFANPQTLDWVNKVGMVPGKSYACVKKVKIVGPCKDVEYDFDEFTDEDVKAVEGTKTDTITEYSSRVEQYDEHGRKMQ